MNPLLNDKATITTAAAGIFVFPAWWPTLAETAEFAAYLVPIFSVILLSVQLIKWVSVFVDWLRK